MKIFISWSGNRSRAVAEILRDWTKCVIQASRPWLSTRDIDRGALWFSEINDQLKDTSVGIICLTQENKGRPWLLFESGALAKGLSSNRVCTLLIDLHPADLEDPLAQFNHTYPERESMWSLVRTLNSCLAGNALDERILEQIYATYWEQFNQKFKAALKDNPPTEKVEPRSEKTLLGEILENTRFLSNRIRRLESAQDMDAGDDILKRDPRRRPMASSSEAKAMVQDLVVSGIATAAIVDHLGSRGVPPGWVLEEIAKIKKLAESTNLGKPPEDSKK